MVHLDFFCLQLIVTSSFIWDCICAVTSVVLFFEATLRNKVSGVISVSHLVAFEGVIDAHWLTCVNLLATRRIPDWTVTDDEITFSKFNSLILDHLFVYVCVPEGFVNHLRAGLVTSILFLGGKTPISIFKVVTTNSIFKDFGFCCDLCLDIRSIRSLEPNLVNTSISWFVGYTMTPMFFVKSLFLVLH
jgi:hypothetical protein